jgi:two-component system phosphate regulon sensor histidine kinase PhoR
MRRRAFVYLLIPAVLLAAAGLAYYSYRYSSALATRERQAILETTRELAEEKILNIEAELVKSARGIFESLDVQNLLDFQQRLQTERPAVESVLVLDEHWQVVPGGSFNRRRATADIAAYRDLVQGKVVPDLQALKLRVGQRAHLHQNYDGRPYLFSAMKRASEGRVYYIVVEADLTYLVVTVFPQYFAVRSRRLYQVIDERGDIVYGFPFQRIPDDQLVDLPFPEVLTRWRLRVAQRQGDLLAARGTRQVIDLVLISSAVSVIVAGLAVLLLAARRAQRANELKSDFISNVSHELKTPLSIINMFGEMLATNRTKSDEQAREYASIIMRESRRLSRLIDNVLDFARMERGAGTFELEEGDIAAVVERSLDIYRHRLERDQIQLSVHVEEGLPAVRIDENAMTLAVLNLVDNALKYSGNGCRLEVAVRRRGDEVALSVTDNGPGIPPEEHELVFERFYRSRRVRLKTARGSGIGLALVKNIAEAHAGRVTLDSELGTGTTFTVWIPVPGVRYS